MNARIVFLVGAIGLTGCMTPGYYQSGDRGDRDFTPTYSATKSEDRPLMGTKNASMYQGYGNRERRDVGREQRKRAFDNFENIVQKSLLRESSPIRILYAIGVDKKGNLTQFQADGGIKTVAFSGHDYSDDTKFCGGQDGIYEYKEGFDSGPCWCSWVEYGEGEDSHMHCTRNPRSQWWERW